MSPTSLRDVPALQPFLHNLLLLFRGSIYAWFPAHAASCLEALNHTEFGSLVSAGSTTDFDYLPIPFETQELLDRVRGFHQMVTSGVGPVQGWAGVFARTVKARAENRSEKTTI